MSASVRPRTPAATQGSPVDLKHPQMPPKAPRPPQIYPDTPKVTGDSQICPVTLKTTKDR